MYGCVRKYGRNWTVGLNAVVLANLSCVVGSTLIVWYWYVVLHCEHVRRMEDPSRTLPLVRIRTLCSTALRQRPRHASRVQTVSCGARIMVGLDFVGCGGRNISFVQRLRTISYDM